jgi:flagellar FliL protein
MDALRSIFGRIGQILGSALGNIFVRIVLIALGAVAAVFVGLALSFGSVDEAARFVDSLVSPEEETTAQGAPVYIQLQPITVTLQQNNGAQLARARMALKVPAAEAEAVEEARPEIVDQINRFLPTIDEEDLSASAGLYRLRAEILRRVRLVDGGERVQDVLITEFLIQ